MSAGLEDLFVWVSRYPDGRVGTVGMTLDGMHLPLVTRDETIARGTFTSVAVMHRERTGQQVWLRRYTAYIDEAPP